MSLIEVLTFRLANGDTGAAFLEADARFQTAFSYQRRGLVRRTTARAADGEWVVVTLWESASHAEAADAAAAGHPAVEDFTAFLDPSTVQRRRYETLD